MRQEQEIFNELASLCSSPGYAHALAYLCYRDSVMKYQGDVTAASMLPLFSKSRLIRTEISTLIGLMVKGDLDFNLPAPRTTQNYIDATVRLLEEVHGAMPRPSLNRPHTPENSHINPFADGAVLREPMFYSGESAYSFQYRDIAPKKYALDDQWLISAKGFSIGAARSVIHCIQRLLDSKLAATVDALAATHPNQWTLLPGFQFSVEDVVAAGGFDRHVVETVLAAFAVPEGNRNKTFKFLHDFNVSNAYPLLRLGTDRFLLFQQYSLAQALYETPFFWMWDDRAYRTVATENRGHFTEEFCKDRLATVFGKERVHRGVNVLKSKDVAGEIDVLVTFGNRAIVLQAKSKRLTLKSREGNDSQIKLDFQQSVQESYDQAYDCACFLADGHHKFVDATGKQVLLPYKLARIYILCIVADHYPALSFQVWQSLNPKITDEVSAPLVTDVFSLDVMTEMLESPLRFLDYMDRRTRYIKEVIVNNEFVAVSYHLLNDLRLDRPNDILLLEDDICADLDAAMTVRRESLPGEHTLINSIRTRLSGKTLSRILERIERRSDPASINLGLAILNLDEAIVTHVSSFLDKVTADARQTREHRAASFRLGNRIGITCFLNDYPISAVAPELRQHCTRRKYRERADLWFGVCLLPDDTSVRLIIEDASRWELNAELEAATRGMPLMSNAHYADSTRRKDKVGPNELCPCGSQRKYKRCCSQK